MWAVSFSRRTHEQRRKCARRRNAANSAGLDIARWRCASITELNTRKVAAAEAGEDESCCVALQLAQKRISGADIVREFIRHRAGKPGDVARFLALGEDFDDYEARQITAGVVLLLARVAGSEDFSRAK